jgi:hypothetical protein
VKFTITVEEHGYGFFPGGDPRLFRPDEEGQRSEEAEAHRRACEAWDRGEHESRSDCAHGPGFVVTTCQFGLGSYTYAEEMWPWEWLRWVAWPHYIYGPIYRWWIFSSPWRWGK